MRKTSWQAQIGLVLATTTFLGSLASAWFGLEKRVTLLEAREKFSHGDLSPYVKE